MSYFASGSNEAPSSRRLSESDRPAADDDDGEISNCDRKHRNASARSPHLDPIERCWGVMHHHVTHNRDYETFHDFRSAILKFLRRTIPKKWHLFRDRITDNFRVPALMK